MQLVKLFKAAHGFNTFTNNIGYLAFSKTKNLLFVKYIFNISVQTPRHNERFWIAHHQIMLILYYPYLYIIYL